MIVTNQTTLNFSKKIDSAKTARINMKIGKLLLLIT